MCGSQPYGRTERNTGLFRLSRVCYSSPMSTTTTKPRGRGRPPLTWLTEQQLRSVRPGTALTIELQGRHASRTIARVSTITDLDLEIRDRDGNLHTIPLVKIKRARPIRGLFEDGDPVTLATTTPDQWRGGVVRTSGTDVLVEQLGGTFAWHPETDLRPG